MNCYEKMIKESNKNTGTISYYDTTISISKFINYVDNFASSLIKLGFKKGDVLTIYLPTNPQSLIAFYACSKLGVIANLVHPLVPIESLKNNLKENNSKGLLFVDFLVKDTSLLKNTNQILIKTSLSDFMGTLKPFIKAFLLCKKIKIKNCLNFNSLLKKDNNINYPQEEVLDVDPVCRMHSSGTTGSPKIVELSNLSLNNLSDNLNKMYSKQIVPGKNALVLLPIFHAYGLGVAIHTCLCNQYNLVLVPKFNFKHVAKLFKKHKINFVAGIPVMFKKIITRKAFFGNHLKYLEDIWCGGDLITDTEVKEFDEIIKKYNGTARIMRGYGLTEVSGVCCVNRDGYYRNGSCGKSIPNTVIEIWDENNNKLKPNQIGEIVITNNSLMEQYLNDDKGFSIKDGNKWIKTGDIGKLDEDGFLYLIGRMKRSFKINAINVYPEEVEKIILHLDFVDEVCVVPYQQNNKTLLRAFITLKQKNIDIHKVKEEIINLCNQCLIKYSIPSDIKILDLMPRTNIGKIDFKLLSEIKQ
ncbi:class I adenylate-forming enzyme family protein [Malacoplasma iowae]|uniref:class I adenylate-forming enzyme family protein n=1 Tax=Malacoplasma iowae TaxID=2116 RepID=UPI002A186C33|nr:class I adenylate-forming enzyme family protein [Malacoplasma iowae]WPL39799.1 class I adenylate-forming enzyme family protein [Malacoplasma iowae]